MGEIGAPTFFCDSGATATLQSKWRMGNTPSTAHRRHFCDNPHLTTFDDKVCWLGGGRLRSSGAPANAEGSKWSEWYKGLRLFQALATPPLGTLLPLLPLGAIARRRNACSLFALCSLLFALCSLLFALCSPLTAVLPYSIALSAPTSRLRPWGRIAVLGCCQTFGRASGRSPQ